MQVERARCRLFRQSQELICCWCQKVAPASSETGPSSHFGSALMENKAPAEEMVTRQAKATEETKGGVREREIGGERERA